MLNTSGGDFCWRLGDVNNSGRVPKARVLSAVGARMEAPKAPRRVGSGDGVSPSPENFSIFELKKASFGAFWVLFLQLN